ncbi:hypothetical protein HZB03_02625 [Candidatus Woesearchaeota archaeon]|nr:hypothetical protein [Candidatus Woesearchaeota archaeon]
MAFQLPKHSAQYIVSAVNGIVSTAGVGLIAYGIYKRNTDPENSQNLILLGGMLIGLQGPYYYWALKARRDEKIDEKKDAANNQDGNDKNNKDLEGRL